MPERRKITPGSKLRGRQDDSNERGSPDIESKLGFKDDLDNKKGKLKGGLNSWTDGKDKGL